MFLRFMFSHTQNNYYIIQEYYNNMEQGMGGGGKWEVELMHKLILTCTSNYVPRNTYLITCDLRCAFDLYTFPGVRWIGPVTPSMKLSPYFSSRQKRKARLPNEGDREGFDLTVVTLASPAALRRRTGTQPGLDSTARRWESEISEHFEGKVARNSEGRRLADVTPVTNYNLHVRVHHSSENILLFCVRCVE